MRGCITLRQKESVSKTKHSWVQTGNIHESKCLKCGLIRKTGNPTRYYENNEEVIQYGCASNIR